MNKIPKTNVNIDKKYIRKPIYQIKKAAYFSQNNNE